MARELPIKTLLLPALLLFPLQAAAYIDPATGTFLLQGLVAGLFAALAALRSFRAKISRFLFQRKGVESDHDNKDI